MNSNLLNEGSEMKLLGFPVISHSFAHSVLGVNLLGHPFLGRVADLNFLRL